MREASLAGCFSETNNSTLMWSHYSQNHTGFALNYDFNSMYSIDLPYTKSKGSLFIDNRIFPVFYSNKRFDATEYVDFHYKFNFFHYFIRDKKFSEPFFDKLFYYKCLLFKSKDWAYEKEWRFIKLTDNDPNNIKPDYSCVKNIRPKEIYLGINISDSDKQELIDIANSKQMKIYQMYLQDSDKEYKLANKLVQ